MDLLTPAAASAPFELRALAMVARAAKNGLARPQTALLEAVQRLVLETELNVHTLEPIDAPVLVKHCDDRAQARQLVRLMVAVSLADGPPSSGQIEIISSFANALGVEEPAVGVIRHLAEGRMLRFRLSFIRHSHLRIYLRNSYRLLGGVLPLVKAILRFRGAIGEDAETAERFHALEELSETTLGYRFHQHCVRAGLPFSGEKGGFPPGALFHDFAHVLAGYDTSPEGEMKAAAFQAGFTKHDDDFFTMLFAIVIHTAGINLAPFPMPVLLGRIGQDQLAMEMLHALQRGAAMTTDLGNNWDFWECVNLPIETARERLGIPPVAEDRLAAQSLSP